MKNTPIDLSDAEVQLIARALTFYADDAARAALDSQDDIRAGEGRIAASLRQTERAARQLADTIEDAQAITLTPAVLAGFTAPTPDGYKLVHPDPSLPKPSPANALADVGYFEDPHHTPEQPATVEPILPELWGSR